jgi:hypothetical protein
MESKSSLPYSQVPAYCCVILPLETLLPGDPSGGIVYLRIVLSSKETSRLVSISTVSIIKTSLKNVIIYMRILLPFLYKILFRNISRYDNYFATNTRDTDVPLRCHLWGNVETTDLVSRDFFAPFRFDATWKFTPLLEFTRIVFFYLTRFGIDDPWPHLCWRLMASDVTARHQSRVWVDCVGVIITWLM